MFDDRSLEAKIQAFKFDHQYMNKFDFVRCSGSDAWVLSMFDKMVFDPSLLFLAMSKSSRILEVSGSASN